jgi:hypothetical protein
MFDYEAINEMTSSIIYKRHKTKSDADRLKYLIEHCIHWTPSVFATISFKHDMPEEKVANEIGRFLFRMTTSKKYYKGRHVLPLVYYNASNSDRRDGVVRNDIHMILCIEKKVTIAPYALKIYDAQKMIIALRGHKYFGNSKVEPYMSKLHGMHYLALRHKQLGVTICCPNKSNRCKRGCEYNVSLHKLLNEEGMQYLKRLTEQ